jgi:hypothetical protein
VKEGSLASSELDRNSSSGEFDGRARKAPMLKGRGFRMSIDDRSHCTCTSGSVDDNRIMQ